MAEAALKDTLHLPQTDFPMRAQLASREPEQLARWRQQAVWQQIQQARSNALAYVLHDGPPYANGALHHGHLLNKILKDIIVKDRTMAGHRPMYQPGWDCHGLPIENQVDRELGAKRSQLSRSERLQACRAWADRFVASQREGFERLGVFADWSAPYLTMAPSYQAGILRAFAAMYRTGLIFRGLRPVHWCNKHQTALAEAEVEYEDKRSPSVMVAFAVAAGSQRPAAWQHLKGPLRLAIWTTTPWTLPGNVAVIVHPTLSYRAVPFGDGHLIVAEPCYDQVGQMLRSDLPKMGPVGEVAEALGSELVGMAYEHPWLDRQGTVLADEFVSVDTGTGLVHAAPAHGVDDFNVVTGAGLEVVSLVNASGHFTAEARGLAGLSIAEGGREIVAELAEAGRLLNETTASVMHRYAHCWRCHEPIIVRATQQWFLALDEPYSGGDTLRARALASLQDIDWVPAWGVERIRGMLANRPDWCLSRQRSWGVTLPIAYCDACHEPWADASAMEHAATVVAGRDAAAMAELPLAGLFGCEPSCQRCGSRQLTLGTDILDVWFDSGVSWLAADQAGTGPHKPADLYLEGTDQHRGWFHSSLLTSLVLTGKAPFKRCLTHGFVVDGSGKKISKSKGNFVDPFASIARDGVDIWRLWVASEDFSQDVRLSPAILRQLTDHYRKLRNTVRYLLGNLHGFVPREHLVAADALLPFDVWALGEVAALTEEVRPLFAACSFHHGMQKISEFCQSTLSAFYLDALKDRLYASERMGRQRHSAQTALYIIVRDVIRLLAPVLAFTAEEAWQHVPAWAEAATPSGSVHVEQYPGLDEPAPLARLRAEVLPLAAASREAWQFARHVRRQVMLALEEARIAKELGSSTEAAVTIELPPQMRPQAQQLPNEAWAELLIVSQVFFVDGPALAVRTARAEGRKCERCWLYREDAVAARGHAAICQRCRDTLG